MPLIYTKFSISCRSSKESDDVNSWSYAQIVHETKRLVGSLSIPDDQFLKEAFPILCTLTLQDCKKNTLSVDQKCYVSSLYDEPLFLFGYITEINHYKKDITHLTISYVNRGGVFTGVFLAKNDTLEKYELPFHIHAESDTTFIIGLCVRHMYNIPPKKTYNSHTHQSYASSKEPTQKARSRILSFYLFRL